MFAKIKKMEKQKLEQEILETQAKLGAAAMAVSLGVTSGELTYSQAVKVYGNWFKDAVTSGALYPIRYGAGSGRTRWFSVTAILALKSAELINLRELL